MELQKKMPLGTLTIVQEGTLGGMCPVFDLSALVNTIELTVLNVTYSRFTAIWESTDPSSDATGNFIIGL